MKTVPSGWTRKLGNLDGKKGKNSLEQAAVRRWVNYGKGYAIAYGSNFVKKVKRKIKSDEYIKTLREYAIPNIKGLIGDDFVLQQNNCSLHVSSKTLEFLDGAGIEVLPWPRRSPDLSLIENVWGLISSRMYNGPQPINLDDM